MQPLITELSNLETLTDVLLTFNQIESQRWLVEQH